jgi:hypothetical protein
MIRLSQRNYTAYCAFALASLFLLGLGGCTVYVAPRPEYYREEPPPPPRVEVETPSEVVVAPEPYQPPPAEVVTVYHNNLDPYGHWVDVAPYGPCWVPNDAPPGWAPYTVGHWVYSDLGWTWVSEDVEASWGPVVYHYGSWYDAPGVGWCWIPGVTWAPAWVAWREGGGYMCWAPLPPQCVFGGGINVVLVDRYVPRERYFAVDERYADSPNIRERIVVNNVTIINRTTNITNITIVNGRARNRGVSPANVERYTGHPVERVALTRATSPEEAARLVAAGRPVDYSPPGVLEAAQKRQAARAQRTEQTQARQEEATQRKDEVQENRTEAQDQRQDAAAAAKAKADAEQSARESQRSQAEADVKAKQEQEQGQREQGSADEKAKADAQRADREQTAADAKAKQEQARADRVQAATDAKAGEKEKQQEKAAAKDKKKPPSDQQPPQP